jgi:ADP-ribose pyrophosphatase
MNTPTPAVISRSQKFHNYPERFPVHEHLAPWTEAFPEYTPVEHDAPRALTPKRKDGDYADPRDPRQVDWRSRIDSFGGNVRLQFDQLTGRPLNPLGRTGISGRGVQNAWGPTMCTDGYVVREAEVPGGKELLVVIRADNGMPTPAGGKRLVNEYNEVIEAPLDTATRENEEEHGVRFDFGKATIVDEVDVDDERNTDNSWYRTALVELIIPRKDTLGLIFTPDPSEVSDVTWLLVEPSLQDKLNANLGHLIVPRLLAY